MKKYLLFLIIIASSCSQVETKKSDLGFLILNDYGLSARYTRSPASGEKIFDSCSNLINKLFGNYFEQDDFHWVGKKLSQAQLTQLAKFSRNAGRKIQQGDQIIIWEPSMVKIGEVIEGQSIPQVIKENGVFERKLLADSRIDTRPREVLQIRLHYADGSTKELKRFYGNAESVSFSSAEDNLREVTAENLTGIDEIEISHTHPTYALTFVGEDGRRFSRANEISQGDYSAVAQLLPRLPGGKRLTIKAITPNGFFYESSFLSRYKY